MLIIIEGIDCCGKGTIVETWTSMLIKEGKQVFDLRTFEKDEKRLPEYEEIQNFDVLLSAEPTFAWVGEAIREEIIRSNAQKYSALSTAHAYALDREILHRRVLIPARQGGKIILQERSVAASMVYQPIQGNSVSLEEVLAIPGNKLACENPPNYLVIPKLKPETAIQRLAERKGKQDDAIFEKLDFLRKSAEEFYSDWFKKFWKDLGTKVVYLNTEGTLEETKRQAKKFLEKVL
ncbi:MAG: hypothetical protein U9P90_01720 [Patescibacteria group bacterium]|nr:hypothetical protein [Patescibacteria group bacterium]